MIAAPPKKGPAVEPRGFPLSEFIVFSLIGGIVVIGILSAVIAGATPKGILTNLGFYVSVAIIFSVLALGFNLQWGYTGLFNAGIAGFYLIGAYVAAIAITPPAPPIIVGDVVVYPGHLGGFSLPLVAGVLLAMVAAGGAAAVVALPALRLRADYLAIATLALAVTIQIVTRNAQSITGGAIGITSVPPPILFQGTDASFLNAITMVGIGSFLLFALLVILQFMSESPWGRVLRHELEDDQQGEEQETANADHRDCVEERGVRALEEDRGRDASDSNCAPGDALRVPRDDLDGDGKGEGRNREVVRAKPQRRQGHYGRSATRCDHGEQHARDERQREAAEVSRINDDVADDDGRRRRGDCDRRDVGTDEVEPRDPGVEQAGVAPLEVETKR